MKAIFFIIGISIIIGILTFKPNTGDDTFHAVYLITLLLMVSSGVIHLIRNKPSETIRNLIIWGLIFVAIIIAYSFRHQFKSELLPSNGIENNSDNSVSFRSSNDNHFYINTIINGENIKFMVDTGASDVTITPSIARKIGIDVDSLQYNKVYSTANGKVQGASIIIDKMEISGINFYNIKASVNKVEMSAPLLGMSFMNKLSKYEVHQDTLTIWP